MSSYYLQQILVLYSICALINAKELESLIGSPIQECINCLCHARTGCWRRSNCASYSISKDYWITAGAPSISKNSGNSDEQYKSCMSNENCILNTIKVYTDQYGERDCNCDGVFDCKDRFAIHIQGGGDCMNPNYGGTFAKRFNDCAEKINVKPMLQKEGGFCEVEIF